MASSSSQQYETFKSLLEGKRGLDKSKPLFAAVVDWLKLPIDLPQEQKDRVKDLVCEAFDINADDLRSELLKSSRIIPQHVYDKAQSLERIAEIANPIQRAIELERELEALLPTEGFFHTYCQYTLNSEAPLAYHIFCALAGLVATINRRVYFNMGSFRLFPPLGVLVLGPSGIKKTSAADIIIGLLNEMQLTPVYAEKLTPEALADSMRGGNATGIVYAPEMTVLVSKQKYMESIIPLLTRFMDSPDLWKSETIMRGKGQLTNVAITCLMCSTLDWFIKNTPESVFGGGFIARNIMVLQDVSTRIIALPQPSELKMRERLIIQLANLHSFEGEVTLAPETHKLHLDWYHQDRTQRLVEHEILETYYQRKPQHLIRFAMALHLATHHDYIICETCWQRALDILTWVERFLPVLANRMFKSAYGEDQSLVLRKIAHAGGCIDHSTLIRRMQYKMGSQQTRNILSNLKEAGYITELNNAVEHTYTLTERYDES